MSAELRLELLVALDAKAESRLRPEKLFGSVEEALRLSDELLDAPQFGGLLGFVEPQAGRTGQASSERTVDAGGKAPAARRRRALRCIHRWIPWRPLIPWWDVEWRESDPFQLVLLLSGRAPLALAPARAHPSHGHPQRLGHVACMRSREDGRQGGVGRAQAQRAKPGTGWAPKTGKEEDVEVGLQYFGKRYLNPLFGRWISADPLAVHAPGQADLNVYAYVSGAVLKNVDPLGLEDEKASASSAPGSGASGTAAIDQAMQAMDRLEFELDPAEAYAGAERQNERNRQEYAEVREAEAFEERVQAVMSGKGELTPESVGSPEVVEATRRVEEEASRAPIDPLLEKIEQDYGVDLKPLTEGLGLIAGFFGKGSPKVKAPGGGTAAASRATVPYKRPAGATTPAQRESVQQKPCVDCGAVTLKQVADHKIPLVKEHYQTGTIDKERMRSIEAVQPQCPTCSARQGAEMSRYSREQRQLLEDD